MTCKNWQVFGRKSYKAMHHHNLNIQIPHGYFCLVLNLLLRSNTRILFLGYLVRGLSKTQKKLLLVFLVRSTSKPAVTNFLNWQTKTSRKQNILSKPFLIKNLRKHRFIIFFIKCNTMYLSHFAAKTFLVTFFKILKSLKVFYTKEVLFCVL